jgi:hypothetical protein
MPITTTPSGGPQGEFSTYTPIYAQTLSSTASSITFSNVPLAYTDLQLVCQTVASGSALNLTVNVNGDAAANYGITSLFARSEGAGTAATSVRASNTSYALANYGTATTTDARSVSRIDFLNYSNNTTFKPIIVRAATSPGNSTFSGNEIITNHWRSTAPISSITLGGGTFASGSTFTLYGIKAAAAPFIPTKAAGGDIVVSDGTYAYHAFLASGTFSAAQSLTCDFMMVGGGGGGGFDSAGGGGAGGFRLLTSQSFTAAQYPVVVGAGGAGSTNYGVNANGGNSSFNSLSAAGGGQGGNGGEAGQNGGSGGGATGGGNFTLIGSGNTPSTSPSQGNNGGQGIFGTSGNRPSGGGGGAGAAGSNGSGSTAGNGGIGAGGVSYTNYAIIDAMAAATGTGVLSSGNYYFASGGGGSVGVSGTAGGSGGIGGGGNGGKSGSTSPTAGSANTGGGGGAGSTNTGASGASGIVIVRYLL